MGEKFDASGSLKRLAWEDNRELVLSTIIDPRFKLSPYLPNERHLEYTNWLIEEAEKVSGIRDQQLDEENVEQELDAPQGMESLAAEFEENMASSVESLLVAPLPSPSELNVRQRAEVEVNDYLHTKNCRLVLIHFRIGLVKMQSNGRCYLSSQQNYYLLQHHLQKVNVFLALLV
uniref:Uncharacterized protein n=1 Tax=Meloidogyne enterolobii TaxID=390850 RepID=A0A6V7V8G5_MELEN|nr:unnamed protein product [Meloidogyne enterolobii]